MDERAALLAGIVANRQASFVPRDDPPAVLIDDPGSPIEKGTTAYLPSTSELLFELPAWMRVRFVSTELIGAVIGILGYSRRERLVDELREAGYTDVHEYDFRGMARAIVAQTNALCRDDPEGAERHRIDAVQALRGPWVTAGGQAAPARESTLEVELPTRRKEWRRATDLYLGEPYQKGALVEALLGRLHPEKFVSELRYGLARRLGIAATELFPDSHLRYRREPGLACDGPTLVEIVEHARQCRALIEEALASDPPERIKARLAEDDRLFTYGGRTVLFYDACVQAFQLARAGQGDEARRQFAEAQRLGGLLRQDVTSTTMASSHANAPNALDASFASGALVRLTHLLGPAKRAR